MVKEEKRSVFRQVVEILAVLGVGMAAALGVALGTLYYYGLNGSYKAGDVLISPEWVYKLDFTERGKESSHYTFEKIEWVDYKQPAGKQVRKQLTREQYAQFYSMIADDRSISAPPDVFSNRRSSDQVSYLTIEVDDRSGNPSKRFQQVELLQQTPFYRIQLRVEGEEPSWAYYYHPSLYENARILFSDDEE